MNKKSLFCALALTAFGLFSSAAKAEVIYTSAAFDNMASPEVNAWCSSCGGNYRVFDAFSLAADSAISSVTFAIQASYGSNWNIQTSFWDSSKQNNLGGQTFAPGQYSLIDLGNDVSKVTVNFASPVLLGAGSYLISWYDSENMGVPGYSGGSTLFQDDNGSTLNHNHIAAFQLNGVSPVPEADTWAMMVLGVGFLGMVSRRRNARKAS